jgi:hypothetical protein
MQIFKNKTAQYLWDHTYSLLLTQVNFYFILFILFFDERTSKGCETIVTLII